LWYQLQRLPHNGKCGVPNHVGQFIMWEEYLHICLASSSPTGRNFLLQIDAVINAACTQEMRNVHNNVNCEISLCINLFLCVSLNQNANTATSLVIYCIHVGNKDIYWDFKTCCTICFISNKMPIFHNFIFWFRYYSHLSYGRC